MTAVATIQEEEFSKQFSLETWKTLARHIRPYLRNFVSLAISSVVVAVCEGLELVSDRRNRSVCPRPGKTTSLFRDGMS